ncbi:hypothetical protein KDN34_05540 [Shewanella yunxiaonensis]|uniref:Uncharacterized protein n=1 Tax=Shewanella yunxiaonensis TaxID=2829809 RepID=A0ABX7YWQ4_9GAMM|nr:hypothetical protein [Shewanella yunxiaonensis]QUN06908.1 hypothetical protein KDN34_05540 [Shewanella yunxiaonensis]
MANHMGFIKSVLSKVLPETLQKSIVKREVRKLVDEKYVFQDELSTQVDELIDRVIEKVGVQDILLIQEIYESVKEKN